MLHIYNKSSDGFLKLSNSEPEAALCKETAWIDIEDPNLNEDKLIERFLDISIPTKAEASEIELSNRLYEEDGAYFMTVDLPSKTETDEPETQIITFILTKDVLVTIRYSEPKAFAIFRNRILRNKATFDRPENIFIGMLETITSRIADIIEHLSTNVELTSKSIFHNYSIHHKEAEKIDYQEILKRIGMNENLISKTNDSLVTIERMTKFIKKNTELNNSCLTDLNSVIADIEALEGACRNMENKLTFMLDATLGMISIEQNMIIKIMSVAAMVFLPPTLIASVYGMNFDFMPELHLKHGYMLALCLMGVSALLPYVYFKRKKWL